jgi:hypothetical protein
VIVTDAAQNAGVDALLTRTLQHQLVEQHSANCKNSKVIQIRDVDFKRPRAARRVHLDRTP